MTWNELKPGATDPLAELPSVLTTNAIAFRQSIEKFSFWTDASGLSAGDMRFSNSSAGPGAARAFFAPMSSLSTALSSSKPLAGRLYVASDTSRLFGFTSNATVQLGGKNSIVFVGSSLATVPSNTRVLVQTGASAQQPGAKNITFPIPYTATAPVVQLQVMSSGTTYFGLAGLPSALQLTTSGFSSWLTMLYGSASTMTILWRSHGTVTL